MQKSIHGIDQSVFAYGIVEDIFDPLFLGRAKIRYLLHHTDNKTDLPTEDLPWSYVLIPINSGRSVTGLREGDWVFSIFQDGILMQKPIVMGILPGIPEDPANPSKGFYDPRTDLLEGHKVPRDPAETSQKADGTGTKWKEIDPKSSYPDERFLTEASNSRLERNEKIDETIVKEKKDNIKIGQTEIPKGSHNASGVGTAKKSETAAWTEKETSYEAKFPYNKVHESESGHIFEVDDTPGAERLHKYHRLGTFEEVHPDGSQVEKIVNDDYRIIMKERFQHVEKNDNLTVDKSYRIFVNKDKEEEQDYVLQVGENGNLDMQTDKGDFNFFMKDGNWNIKVHGDINIVCDGDANIRVKGNANTAIEGDCNLTSEGNASIRIDQDAIISVGQNALTNIGGDSIKIVEQDSYELIMGNCMKIIMGTHIQTQVTQEIPNGPVYNAPFFIIIMAKALQLFQMMLLKTSRSTGKSDRGNQDPAPLLNNTPKDFVPIGDQKSFVNARGMGSIGGEKLLGLSTGLSSNNPLINDVLANVPGFNWVPVSDDGKLLILTDTPGKGLVSSIELIDPESSLTIEKLLKANLVANAEREHFRFSKPGGEYPDNLIVKIIYQNKDMKTDEIAIPDTVSELLNISEKKLVGPAPAIRHGGGFLWKPKSDGGGGPVAGKLVVLHTNAAAGATIYRAVRDPNNIGKWIPGEKLDEGKDYGKFSGGSRTMFRFTKYGSEYGPGPVFVNQWFIGNPALRNE